MKQNLLVNTIVCFLILTCFVFTFTARAVSPAPDGGYPNPNTADGDFALNGLTTGTSNTAVGAFTLYGNTTGNYNTAVGQAALSNTTGDGGTAVGFAALYSNTIGVGNTAIGFQALLNNTSGGNNTANGYNALFGNSTGLNNTADGAGALGSNTTGGFNTGYGSSALINNTTGGSNIGIGYNAGKLLTTGDNNIDIGNEGVAAEANTIRIGTQGTQTATFVAGINGVALTNPSVVVIDSNGQLGTANAAQLASAAVGSAQIANGAVGSAQVASGGAGSAQIANSSITAAKIANGQVVKNANGVTNALTLAAASTGGPWLLNGTTAYYNAGRVGIGTKTPSHQLTIATTGVTPSWTTSHWAGALALDNGAAIGWRTNGAWRFGMGHSGNGFYMFRTASDPGTNANPALYDFSISDAGNVGIGTASPVSKLNIISAAGNLPPRVESLGTNGFAAGWDFYRGSTPLGYVGVPDGAAAFGPGEMIVFGGASTPLSLWANQSRALTIDTSARVGIGTTVPANKLTVLTPTSSYGLEHTDGSVRLGTYVGGTSSTGGWLGTISNDKLNFFTNNGAARMTVDTTGWVGIGTNSPQTKLHIFDSGAVDARIQTTGPTNTWTRLNFVNGNGEWDIGTSVGFNGDQFFISRAGASAITFGIQPNGDVYTQGVVSCPALTVRGGSDVAEPFQMNDETVDKGAVVVIDEQRPGRLKRSARAYDRRVAGIVSGANGIHPGIALHQEGVLEGGQDVALSGRVYVQADTSNGEIEAGDMLTSSDIPGYAMKATDWERARGAIIGKAMSPLHEKQGMVLVLVTLQ